VASAGIPEAAEIARAALAVETWMAAEGSTGGAILAAERQEVTDGTASHRWYLRLRGEEKEVITLWLSLHQRTLRHEAQLMPAPETRAEETFRYLLRRNAELLQMSFCLGPEDAVYLVGRVPAPEVDADVLDRIAGSTLAYIDGTFPTAMALAHPWYRPRPARARRSGGVR